MKTLRPLLILMTLLISWISCHREEEYGGGNTLYLVAESLYPMLFDKGSYWIYKNLETNNIDTVVLIEIQMDTIGPFNIGKGYTKTEQVYNLNYSSKVLGEYQEQYIGYVISMRPLGGGFVYLSSHQIGDFSNNAKITAIHDSLIIDGKTFKNIVELDIQKAPFIDHNMNRYYVDSIGLVKKEIKEGNIIQETWELMEYKINSFKRH